MIQPTFYGKMTGNTAAILRFEILFEIWTLLAIFCFFHTSWIFISFLNLQISYSMKIHITVFILDNVGVRRQTSCYQCSSSYSLVYSTGKFHHPVLH